MLKKLSILLLPALVAAPAIAGEDPFAQALQRAGLRPADLAFPLLPAERDSLRLRRVDEVLMAGRRLDHWADSLCRALSSTGDLAGLGALLQGEVVRAGSPSAKWPLAAPAPPAFAERGNWDAWIQRLGALAGHRLLSAAAVEVLEQDLSDLLQEDPDLGERSVFELDSLLRLAEAEARRRQERLERADLPDVAQLLAILAELDGLHRDLPLLREAAAGERVRDHPCFGPVLHADERVAIGAAGPNTWRGELPPIIIDLGGDDRYEGPVAVTRGGVSLLIDLDGDDHYLCRGEIGPAATVGGLSLLLDLAGNDRYEGEFAALGAALGGMALLVDHGGDDHYSGDTFCLGAGSLGIGVLLDGGGNDLYLSSLYGQGFGHLAGLGLLQDTDGHDHYLMQPRFVDQIRYEDHHLTLGQGFGYGQRPDLSGGIGLLHDLGGNDLYSADIYGQGAAYWWSLGALVDRAGNDRYLAWQYAQGAGVHLAAGLLLDQAGLDVYQSRGVSQGCGHDLALGWLLDMAGDDSYVAWDLSQGAGSANGCGLLTDLAGQDLYAMRGQAKPRAYGDPRRRTGSIGFFLDAQGEDLYLGPGANDSLWSGSLRGLGQDWSAPAAATVGTPAAAEPVKGLDSLFRADDRVERLYVWAIRLEPKWSRERDLARAALKERPADLAGLIRQRRLMASRISWERHALKDLVAAMGEAALPLLVEAVEQEIPGTAGEEREARLSERGFALWTLSETRTLGEASLFADWWRQGVGRQEPGQAALLLECLAERGGAPEPLLEGLGWPHAGLRRSAAWGLGRLPSTAVGREALLTALGDSVLAVRISAFESLAQDSLLDGRRVAAALFDEERPSLARRELVRLLARRDGLLARRLVPRLEADPVLAAETDWIRAGLPPEAAPSPRQRRP